jgi:glycosyltransferase involved in cell wall biosynthesis
MKILWATPHCLLSNIDGAAILALNLLKGLSNKGHEVVALTISSASDSNNVNPTIHTYEIEGVHVVAFEIKSNYEEGMTNKEINDWLSLYISTLEVFSPSLVIGYGGLALDMHVYSFAKFKNIKAAALLLNTSFNGTYWCKDIDLIFTDSRFTSDFYRTKLGIESTPLGPYIDKARYKIIEENPNRFEVLFVNSINSKGARLVGQLAYQLNKIRADIYFHLIDGRGDSTTTLKEIASALDQDFESLKNIRISKSYSDVVEVLRTAKCVIAPSLADESLGLIVVEAKMNLVPSIVSKNGGLLEAVGEGGVVLEINEKYREPPYEKLFSQIDLQPWIDAIIKIFSDDAYYDSLVQKCRSERSKFNSEEYITRFENLLSNQPLLS